MALMVEDGSIVANADSYATVADWTTYATSMGWTLTGDAASQEADMRRSYAFLNREYTYLGRRTDAAQTGQFPRFFDEPIDGFSVASDSIPTPIIEAQYEIAWLFNQGNDLFAYTSGAAVKRKKEKVDVIEEETEYFTGSDVQARILAVEGLLRPYISGSQPGQNSGNIPLVRG